MKDKKEAKFHPAALKVIQGFSEDVKRDMGVAIFSLQMGEKLEMPLSKPMRSVGRGVEEIRITDKAGIYRAFYLAKFKDKILIFHAFTKKTQATPKKEIQTGQKRLKEIIDE